MCKGDRVKLTDTMAQVVIHGLAPHKRKMRIDWTKRRGSVISATSLQITIKWDDAKHYDTWPPRAVEKVH